MTSARREKRQRVDLDRGAYETWEIAGTPSIERVSAALQDRRSIPDRMFDYYLPKPLRSVSNQHWTPLAAAVRVAEWLTDFAIDSVLDVGSGVGKFCISSALACSARFVGIEQRPDLVAEASRLAHTFRVDDRVSFVCRTFERGSLPEAEAYYLYNPFGENLLSHQMRIDSRVELSADRHTRDSRAFEDMLWALPEGAYVITYNGFGGCMPESYEELRTDRSLPSVLSLWRKHEQAL